LGCYSTGDRFGFEEDLVFAFAYILQYNFWIGFEVKSIKTNLKIFGKNSK